MRYFFLPLFFLSFICHAQNGTSFESAKKKTDTTTNRFIISFNAGLNFPEGDYGPPITYLGSDGPNGEFYGLSADGFHVDLNGIYMLSPNFGIEARFGIDENGYSDFKVLNSANSIFQYQAGFYFAINPTESKFNISFIGLIGLATANISVSNDYQDLSSVGNISATVLPGTGNGFAFYGGIVFTFKVDKMLYFNLSAGYLAGSIDFPNSTTTTYNYSFNPYPNGSSYTTVSNSDMKMNMGIIQTSFGFSYHL